MKFKAENFEATATEVEGTKDWVITSPGGTSHSVRMHREAYGELTVDPDAVFAVEVLTDRGWVDLAPVSKPRPLTKALATAIAVLYSVPGVVCVEES